MTMQQKVVVYERTTGRIVSSAFTQHPELLETDLLGILIGGEGPPNASYVEDGQVILAGTAPSSFHDFDFTAKSWCLNLPRAWFEARFKRDTMLAETDWRVVKAAETGVPLAEVWVAYRQALRDITLQTDPRDIVWPVQP